MKANHSIANQLSLLGSFAETDQNQSGILALPDAEVIIQHHFFHQNESDRIFSRLYQNVAWKQEKTFLYGKQVALPRLTAWYGDTGKNYKYSKIVMEPQPWLPILEYIKSKVEERCGEHFNSVLLNLYRDGRDSIAWHSDDEQELGNNPEIGSLSFGGTRSFRMRHKFQKGIKSNLQLTHGSLLIMRGETQHYWQHQIPKTRKLTQPRINLTFRKILD